MAGHMVSLYLSEKGFDVTSFVGVNNTDGRGVPVDLLLPGAAQRLLTGKYDVVVNCVGVLLPDADENRPRTVKLNSMLPHELVLARDEGGYNTRIIHISTDCVFSGKNGPYNEVSDYDGQYFYDRSKALGEINNGTDLTFRMSIVGPELKPFGKGSGLFHWFMQQSGEINGFINQYWNGITTLELAKGIEAAIGQGLTGIYHLVTPELVTKLGLLTLFESQFHRGVTIKGAEAKVSTDKELINNRTDFWYDVDNYKVQLSELSVWMWSHPELYRQYSGEKNG